MKRLILGVGLLFSAAAAGAQPVDVGRGDWARFPVAAQNRTYYLSPQTMDEIEALGRDGSCRVSGLSARSVDIEIPFVLRFNDAGHVERIVLRDVGCPELERLLGGAVQSMAIAGEYRATRGPGWYRSTIQFANQ